MQASSTPLFERQFRTHASGTLILTAAMNGCAPATLAERTQLAVPNRSYRTGVPNRFRSKFPGLAAVPFEALGFLW